MKIRYVHPIEDDVIEDSLANYQDQHFGLGVMVFERIEFYEIRSDYLLGSSGIAHIKDL